HFPRARIVPAIVLAAGVFAAPAPQYRATETTMAQLFPGERLAFTGTLVRHGDTDALVRYAITCCRADAQPVAVRLSQPLRYAAGSWIRAEGYIARHGDQLVFKPNSSQQIATPNDPFVYR
ncbi:MAG: TIGR03943 family putative permease subunit, partial [Vulcanimicrobiaceae bacterium]